MSKYTDKQLTIEIMKYKKEKLSYALVLLGLVLNGFYFISLYKNNANFYYTIQIGASVLYNLIFMLMVFLSAENIKVYNRKFSYVLIVLGLMQLVRIIGFPKAAYDAGEMTYDNYAKLIIYLVLSAGLLISGAIVAAVRSTRLQEFLTKEKEQLVSKGE